MILIITHKEDDTANRIQARLQKQQHPFLRIDQNQIGQGTALSVAYSPHGLRRTWLHQGDQTIDLSSIQVVWLRRPSEGYLHQEISNPYLRYWAKGETVDFWRETVAGLQAKWVPTTPHHLSTLEVQKTDELGLATQLGFTIPDTIVTNHPQTLAAFYRKHAGQIICKRVYSGRIPSPTAKNPEMDLCGAYTRRVTLRDLGYFSRLQYAPTLFQQLVPKAYELRVTVIGERVIAVKIESQALVGSQIDWRKAVNSQTLPYSIYHLPPDLEKLCLQLVKKMGLCYGAIDLIVRPDGEYIFVEINPTGQYGWLESQIPCGIEEALCKYLIEMDTSGSERYE